jgi:hypothetical protein
MLADLQRRDRVRLPKGSLGHYLGLKLARHRSYVRAGIFEGMLYHRSRLRDESSHEVLDRQLTSLGVIVARV